MQLLSIEAALPARRISNDEILDLVKFYSKNLNDKSLNRLCTKISALFNRSQAKTRYWLGDGQRPIDLLKNAFNNGLNKAGLSIYDIDLVIYCGVHRGFLEPAMASLLSKQVGINPKMCFDISDACLGWATALSICQKLLRDDGLENAVIISAEFPMKKGSAVYPSCFTYDSDEEILTKFAGLTMGEGLSVAVLNGSGKDWKFARLERTVDANLCTVPLRDFNLYCDDDGLIAANGPEVFTASIMEMALKGVKPAIDTLKTIINHMGEPDIIIPHNMSGSLPITTAKSLGMHEKIYSTFSELGNLSTASIPCSLVHAIECGKIVNKSKVIGWSASAGMKYCAFNLPLMSLVS